MWKLPWWFLKIFKQSIGIMDCDKIHILGCRTNQECFIEDPKKPICDNGLCTGGF